MNKYKVDFFFVGYPKSGSTTFYNLFKSHPECFAPDLKEPKYFSTDINREAKRNLGNNYYQLINSEKEYNGLYSEGLGKIKGDFNPYNILSTEAAENIFAYNTNGKIVISIREPVSFLRSFHFQSLYNMVENESNFMKALSLEEKRHEGKNIPQHCHNPFYLYYSSLVEYEIQIRRFTDLFGYNKIKIILFDDIVKSEQEVSRSIMQFLKVTDISYTLTKVDRNPSHALRYSWLRSIILSPRIKKWIYTKTPRNLLLSGAKISQAIFKKGQEKPFVSQSDIDSLKTRFRPNVIELNSFLNKIDLLDRDLLSVWNY